MTNKISDKDKKDWDSFLSSKEKLLDKENTGSKKEFSKIKSIDLHGFSLDDANKFVENFIYESYEKGTRELIVVTGKGLHSQNYKDPYISNNLGILKYSVPEFIENNRKLMEIIHEIKDAKIEDGGSGAFYIFLKKNNP